MWAGPARAGAPTLGGPTSARPACMLDGGTIERADGAGPLSEDELRERMPELFDVGTPCSVYKKSVRALDAHARRDLAKARDILREAGASDEDVAHLERIIGQAIET